jgi:uncharacterized C2H2 Zn-finger protein
MSQVHEKNKPIQCPQCPTRFGFKGEFNRHFVNVHGGKGLNSQYEYTYQKGMDTNNTTAILGVKASLKKHMYVQDKNKPFQCISCPTRFGFKDDLERHLEKAHEGK